MENPSYIKVFNHIGGCLIDIDELCKVWDDRFYISQWGDEYTLIEYEELYKEDCRTKVSISDIQAKEIMLRLHLLPIKSTMFSRGCSWRTRPNIERERKRIKDLLEEKQTDIKVLNDVIYEFDNALSHK